MLSAAAGAAAAMPAGIRDYMITGGFTQMEVEAICIGVWKFKGNPAPLQMVHVTTGDLRLRPYASEPPKGKVQRAGLGLRVQEGWQERIGSGLAAGGPPGKRGLVPNDY